MPADRVFTPLLLTIALTSACAGGRIYRLEPAGADATYWAGQPGYRRTLGELSLGVFFAGRQGTRVVFAAIAVNTSSTATVALDAGAFALRGDGAPIAAVDPEVELARIAAARSDGLRDFIGAADALTSVADLALLFADLGATGPDAERRDRQRKERAQQREDRERQELERQRALDVEEQRWRAEFLRRTDLGPGERIAGLVAFEVRGLRSAELQLEVTLPHRGTLVLPFRRPGPTAASGAAPETSRWSHD